MSKRLSIKVLCSILLLMCTMLFWGCDSILSKQKTENMIANSDNASFQSAKKIANGNTYQHKAEVFNGTFTIHQIDTSKTKNINLDLEIKAGTFQLVLVNDKGETKLTDTNYSGTLDLSSYSAGIYTLKMKGEAANFNLEIIFS